jgi:hypothetical protein
MDRFKGTIFDAAMKNLFWSAREATTEGAYLLVMDAIRAVSEDVYTYLTGIDNWQLYKAIIRGNMVHCMRSNNLVESVFAWTKQARGQSPLYMLIWLLKATFDLNNEQRDLAMRWTYFISQAAQRIGDAQRLSLCSDDSQRRYEVTCADIAEMVARVCFVGDALTHGATHNVNLTKLTCSCGFSLQAGGLCRHVYVVIDRLRLPNGKLRFALNESHFHETSRTTFWKRMYRESPAVTGIFPAEEQVHELTRIKLSRQVPVIVVKPWCEMWTKVSH